MSLPALAKAAARRQMLATLLVLSAMAPILGSLAVLTRNQALAAWFDRTDEEQARQTKLRLVHPDWMQKPELYFSYEQLPQAAFSKGGVYFLGSSCVEFATKFWELPPDLQALVHNYGMPAANPKCESFLLRYLIEKRGMLTAGGEKTLVVFGAFYETSHFPSQSLPLPWVNAWEGFGHFACDPQSGIREVPVGAVAKFMAYEEAHQADYLNRLQDLLLQKLPPWLRPAPEAPRRHNPAAYLAKRREEMEPDWKRKITEAVQVFGQNIDYLQARHVQVRVIFLPEGNWEHDLPYSPEYQRQIAALCAEKHVPLSDWSKLLTDEDLADSTHPNIFGMEKIQPAFLEIALSFLRSTHVWPPSPSPRDQSGK